jgi:hypothetical protein
MFAFSNVFFNNLTICFPFFLSFSIKPGAQTIGHCQVAVRRHQAAAAQHSQESGQQDGSG